MHFEKLSNSFWRHSPDNFLNRFENYDATENKIAVETAKKFVNEKASLKALWFYGESGIGKSHILLSMIYSHLEEQVKKRFSKLELNQYPDAEIYGGRNALGMHSNEIPNRSKLRGIN